MTAVDVLIPTFGRQAALAVTLATLTAQTLRRFRVVVSDQTDDGRALNDPVVKAPVRLLEAQGRPVELLVHLPRRGMAEQRQFLLHQARAPYALFLDDDVLLERDLLERLLRAIRRAGCGFVGSALLGLGHAGDERPDQQRIEFWEGPVEPERIVPGDERWRRYELHNAANLLHVQRRLRLTPRRERLYKVAWVGGCVMYDVEALRSVGGFGFWESLPAEHAGEDVLAQLRVMAARGGAGLIPSGAYHQELPTTIPRRAVNAPERLVPSPAH